MSLWNTILETNTFNFIILLVILAVLYHVLHISQMLESIKNNIISSIENAKFEQADAINKLKDAKNSYSKLDDELKVRLEDAEKKSSAIKKQILHDADSRVNAIEQNVINVIASEEKSVSNRITEKTLKASVELAKKIIVDKLEKTPELHNKFIDESIGEL